MVLCWINEGDLFRRFRAIAAPPLPPLPASGQRPQGNAVRTAASYTPRITVNGGRLMRLTRKELDLPPIVGLALTLLKGTVAVPHEAAIPGGRSSAPRCEGRVLLMHILVHRIGGKGTPIAPPAAAAEPAWRWTR